MKRRDRVASRLVAVQPIPANPIARQTMPERDKDIRLDITITVRANPLRIKPLAAGVDNQTMTVTVTLSQTNQQVGSFTVKFGAPGSFAKCV